MRSTIAIVGLALLTSSGACFLPEVDPPDLPGAGDGGVVIGCEGTLTGDVTIPYVEESARHSFECTIDGNVSIGAGADANSVGTLATVKNVTGSITVWGTDLNPGTIFANLEEVGGELRIRNSAIIDFAGCDQLVSAGDIFFDDNDLLTSITGFSALEEVGILQIRTAPALETIDAFASLATATTVEILTANALTDITGFGTSFADIGQMNINTVHSLVTLPSMPNLIHGQNITINQSAALAIAALANLETVVNLSLTHNDSMHGQTFPALTTVSNKLTISYNDNLTSLDGFDALTSIVEWHICSNHSSLTQEIVDAWLAIHGPTATGQCI